MARPKASDHDGKRQAILEQAVILFARHGYDRTSLTMLAQACGMSKALLYHYHADKSQLLFDIIRTHLEYLLEVTAPLGAALDETPRLRAERLARALLDAYRRAGAYHQIQIGQLHLLPRPQQRVLKDLERVLVARFAEAIAACLPATIDPVLLKPLTMSLFGMLNWHYLWFRDDGPLGREEYARLAVTLVVDGAAAVRDPASEHVPAVTAAVDTEPAATVAAIRRSRNRSPRARSSGAPGR